MINIKLDFIKIKFHYKPIVFLTIGLCFFYACENDLNKIEKVTSKNVLPIETSENIEIIYTDYGKIKTSLRAPLLERYAGEEPKLEFPKGLNLVFYDSLQNPESSLKADYAIHDEKANKIIAKTNVEVINEKGEKLNTEKLIWERETKQIYTDEFVTITTEDELIMGEGLVSNESFTKYTIKKIKGTINLKDEEGKNE
jgi:LPS export ABC transporter protein LptC